MILLITIPMFASESEEKIVPVALPFQQEVALPLVPEQPIRVVFHNRSPHAVSVSVYKNAHLIGTVNINGFVWKTIKLPSAGDYTLLSIVQKRYDLVDNVKVNILNEDRFGSGDALVSRFSPEVTLSDYRTGEIRQQPVIDLVSGEVTQDGYTEQDMQQARQERQQFRQSLQSGFQFGAPVTPGS